MKSFVSGLFAADANYEGVRRINIYVMRLFFGLMFFFVGSDSWTAIINHQGQWEPLSAVAFSVFAAYSTLSLLGIFYTLRMLPIMVFMIIYKTIWLIIAAYPLWVTNQLAGSAVEGMANVFIWVVIPIAFMPWSYFFSAYIWRRGQKLSTKT